jgi:DNA topoisomerase-3
LIEAQHNDAPQVLAAVRQFNPHLAAVIDRADPSIKSRTWNDKKITAHHGIIPTMQKGNLAALSEQERNIYDVIVLGYLAQFYPVHEYLQTDITVEIERESFKTTGRVVTKNGWKDVFSDPEEEAGDGEDDESQGLPAMKQGDSVTCAQVQKREAKTKAPPRFNEGSLGRAMENIHRFVTDPEHKKLLRDGDGIGTSATRASIIGELKRRKFLEPKGKNIISTTLGRSLVDALPESVKSPVLTALYERMLKGIEEGTASLDAFISKQETYVRDQVAKANTGSVSIAGGKEAATASSIHKCMACGHPLARRPSSKKRGFYWWGCTNYPTCKQTYFDLKGRPDYSKGREQAATTGKE